MKRERRKECNFDACKSVSALLKAKITELDEVVKSHNLELRKQEKQLAAQHSADLEGRDCKNAGMLVT